MKLKLPESKKTRIHIVLTAVSLVLCVLQGIGYGNPYIEVMQLIYGIFLVLYIPWALYWGISYYKETKKIDWLVIIISYCLFLAVFYLWDLELYSSYKGLF